MSAAELPGYYSADNPPPLDVLGERIFAVHATDSLPTTELIADLNPDSWKQNPSYDEAPPHFRPTNHFSLGELCVGHGQASWENKPYAAIVPLAWLVETGQVVNVNAHDTFTVGNVALDEGVTLIVPEAESVDQLDTTGPIIHRYDSTSTTLRQAVAEAIGVRGGWSISSPEGSIKLGDPAFLANENINTSNYFRNLLEAHPNVSFGSHSVGEQGEAYRFGRIDGHALQFSSSRNSMNRAFHAALARHHITKLDAYIVANDFNEHVQQSFRSAADRLTDQLGEQDIAKASNSEEYLKFWAQCMQDMPRAELDGIINDNVELFEHVDQKQLLTYYALARWTTIGTEQAASENIPQILSNHLLEMPVNGSDEALGHISYLGGFLKSTDNKLSTALDILEYAPVREYCRQQLGLMSTDDDKPLTLQSIISRHPRTAQLFEEMPDYAAQDPEAYALLGRIGDVITEMPIPFEETWRSDFGAAQNRAFYLELAQEIVEDNLRMVRKPMNYEREPSQDTLGLYDQLMRSGSAAKLWDRIGLGDEYSKAFANDEDFWNSGDSLLQIYDRLNML